MRYHELAYRRFGERLDTRGLKFGSGITSFGRKIRFRLSASRMISSDQLSFCVASTFSDTAIDGFMTVCVPHRLLILDSA